MEVDMVADSLADMLADMEVKYEFIAEETTIQKSQTGKQWLLTTHSRKNSDDLVDWVNVHSWAFVACRHMCPYIYDHIYVRTCNTSLSILFIQIYHWVDLRIGQTKCGVGSYKDRNRQLTDYPIVKEGGSFFWLL